MLELSKIHQGDALTILRTLPDESVHCIVTSPPYYGLRDYGVDGQIGLEETPEAFIDRLVEIFREARRVLRSDGTAWINMGDSYSTGRGGRGDIDRRMARTGINRVDRKRPEGMQAKNLLGMPWRLAFALQADGWYLRQDIIWHKPNPMPESVKDRCTKAHEYIFLLSKSARYYYDQDAVLEPCSPNTHARISQELANQIGSYRANGGAKDNGPMKAVSRKTKMGKIGTVKNNPSWDRACCMPVEKQIRMPKVSGWASGPGSHSTLEHNRGDRKRGMKGKANPLPGREQWHGDDIGFSKYLNADGFLLTHEKEGVPARNKRSVWTVPTVAFKEAHFAVFPEALVEPCILAGCPRGGVVMDPFFGSGTVGLVAVKNNRNYVGIELNPEYIRIAKKRLSGIMVRLPERS